MSTYTTNTSDKSKDEALRWWKMGAFGFLGLEYFYVGRVKRGIIRIAISVFLIIGVLGSLVDILKTGFSGLLSLLVFCMVIWGIASIPNYYRLKMGKFQDNVGAALRE